MIEALLRGLVDAVAFGFVFALGVFTTVVLMIALVVAMLYWLELKER